MKIKLAILSSLAFLATALGGNDIIINPKVAPGAGGPGPVNVILRDTTGAYATATGGGGAATVADGADVVEGSLSDAVASAGGAGTVSAKLRLLTSDIAAVKASVATIATNTIASATEVKSTALETSHVLKASAGSLVYVGVHNTGGTALSIMIINATSLPANGAVTLLYPPIKIPAGGDISFSPPVPIAASIGIVIAGSTTDTFSLTVGGTVLSIYGQVR